MQVVFNLQDLPQSNMLKSFDVAFDCRYDALENLNSSQTIKFFQQ